jgi:CheY-like chemotaxis protein
VPISRDRDEGDIDIPMSGVWLRVDQGIRELWRSLDLRSILDKPLVPHRRVLVVDDNLDYVRSMTMLLRSMGHECSFAINGTVALEVARVFKPDTVLLDVGLPDGDGRLLAAQLRREPGLPEMRIVCVTGRAEADPARSIESGCDAHFVKPVDPALMENLLEKDR